MVDMVGSHMEGTEDMAGMAAYMEDTVDTEDMDMEVTGVFMVNICNFK